MVRTGVEESRRRLDEVPEGQRIVGLADTRIVSAMELDRDTHPQVLGALQDLARIVPQEVPVHQGLESKVVEPEVATVVNPALNRARSCDREEVLGHHIILRKHLHRLNEGRRSVLLVVVDHKTCCESPVIRVVASLHHRTRLSRELVELGRLNTIRDLRANLLRHDIGIHMVEIPRKALNPLEHFIKANGLSSATACCDVNVICHRQCLLHAATL